MRGLAGWVAALPLVLVTAAAQATNTGNTRPFTTEWACENGRTVLFNAHPRRPREEAWITYIGKRAEVRLTKSEAGQRYVDKDGAVIWHVQGDVATLQFPVLLDKPLACERKKQPATKK